MRNSHCQNKFESDCPITYTAQLIADTWTIMIIKELLSGEKRFTDLLKSLKGVSSKTLTERLVTLEEKNLIQKSRYSETPPRVEYSLTKMGEKLHNIITDMKLFGMQYIEDENRKNN